MHPGTAAAAAGGGGGEGRGGGGGAIDGRRQLDESYTSPVANDIKDWGGSEGDSGQTGLSLCIFFSEMKD